MSITLEEAIKTAIDYERKVEKTYRDAVDKASDPAGKRVLSTLADEELGHIKYLESRLDEWKRNGAITVESLDTVVPSRERIQRGVERLKQKIEKKRYMSTEEQDLLQRAMAVEEETAAFYRRMVSELSDEGQKMFERFVEIEEGHSAIVQAELDSVQGLGYWFDVSEWKFEDG